MPHNKKRKIEITTPVQYTKIMLENIIRNNKLNDSQSIISYDKATNLFANISRNLINLFLENLKTNYPDNYQIEAKLLLDYAIKRNLNDLAISIILNTHTNLFNDETLFGLLVQSVVFNNFTLFEFILSYFHKALDKDEEDLQFIINETLVNIIQNEDLKISYKQKIAGILVKEYNANLLYQSPNFDNANILDFVAYDLEEIDLVYPLIDSIQDPQIKEFCITITFLDAAQCFEYRLMNLLLHYYNIDANYTNETYKMETPLSMIIKYGDCSDECLPIVSNLIFAGAIISPDLINIVKRKKKFKLAEILNSATKKISSVKKSEETSHEISKAELSSNFSLDKDSKDVIINHNIEETNSKLNLLGAHYDDWSTTSTSGSDSEV